MAVAAGALMDGVYRRQRHIYDLSRKYFLLGRDGLIEALDPPDGGTVLEIGCGTGRNLILAARRWPQARCFGLDVSGEMLKTARAHVDRAGLADRIVLGEGDAAGFDALALFGADRFDRVMVSYALSMIPEWRAALALAVDLCRDGRLLVVDFGQQEGLPDTFRRLLFAWLGRFHVAPRADLPAALAAHAEAAGGRLEARPLYRGYAWHAQLTR